MKILTGILLGILLLSAGAALGYAVGRDSGFSTGSEWALVQAGIAAREAGAFMPVSYRDGHFHVILMQPRGMYSKARTCADSADGSVPRLQAAEERIAFVAIQLQQ